MKAFAFFMAIIIILTGFDFCKDEEIATSNSGDKFELVNANIDHDEKGEVCSPFCNCTRCPFSVVLPQNAQDILVDEVMDRNLTFVDSGIPTQLSPSLWQPPKLA